MSRPDTDAPVRRASSSKMRPLASHARSTARPYRAKTDASGAQYSGAYPDSCNRSSTSRSPSKRSRWESSGSSSCDVPGAVVVPSRRCRRDDPPTPAPAGACWRPSPISTLLPCSDERCKQPSVLVCPRTWPNTESTVARDSDSERQRCRRGSRNQVDGRLSALLRIHSAMPGTSKRMTRPSR